MYIRIGLIVKWSRIHRSEKECVAQCTKSVFESMLAVHTISSSPHRDHHIVIHRVNQEFSNGFATDCCRRRPITNNSARHAVPSIYFRFETANPNIRAAGWWCRFYDAFVGNENWHCNDATRQFVSVSRPVLFCVQINSCLLIFADRHAKFVPHLLVRIIRPFKTRWIWWIVKQKTENRDERMRRMWNWIRALKKRRQQSFVYDRRWLWPNNTKEVIYIAVLLQHFNCAATNSIIHITTITTTATDWTKHVGEKETEH